MRTLVNDAIIEILKYCSSTVKEQKRLGYVNRNFRAIVEKTAVLHKHLKLTGGASSLVAFLRDPPLEAIKYLEILELDQISSSSPEEYHRFWSLLKTFLLALVDNKANFHSLILIDSTESFFISGEFNDL